MPVVAKFSVQSVETAVGYNKVTLKPVYAPPEPEHQGYDANVTSKEDGAFWEATPNGELWMVINNAAAAEQFQPGDRFYVTFDRAPE